MRASGRRFRTCGEARALGAEGFDQQAGLRRVAQFVEGFLYGLSLSEMSGVLEIGEKASLALFGPATTHPTNGLLCQCSERGSNRVLDL